MFDQDKPRIKYTQVSFDGVGGLTFGTVHWKRDVAGSTEAFVPERTAWRPRPVSSSDLSDPVLSSIELQAALEAPHLSILSCVVEAFLS